MTAIIQKYKVEVVNINMDYRRGWCSKAYVKKTNRPVIILIDRYLRRAYLEGKFVNL